MTVLQSLRDAEENERLGNLDLAAKNYITVFRAAFGHEAATRGLDRLAKALFAEAMKVRDRGDNDGAIAHLVRSIELNPTSGETRAELARLLSLRPSRDMTAECLIFPDGERARKFYGDAIQAAVDFCVYGGIIGDIYEFGVLAGWTSRLFAERMRDARFYGDLHLFDSFEGLPRQKSLVDAASYDVQRGIWEGDMAFPDSLIAELGAPMHVHVLEMLSRVISRDRIHVRKGYFCDSLKQPLQGTAAIVHFDCDLHQSTVEVLDALEQHRILQDGTVMMFDDWNCNRANPAFGQRRALREFLTKGRGRYAVSPYLNYGFNCAAFILHDFDAVPPSLRIAQHVDMTP